MRTPLTLVASLSLWAILFTGGCAYSGKLGNPQEPDPEAIKAGAQTGAVIGSLTGLPGGSTIGEWVGGGIAAIATAFGLHQRGEKKAAVAKHEGENKGWTEAVGTPAQAVIVAPKPAAPAVVA